MLSSSDELPVSDSSEELTHSLWPAPFKVSGSSSFAASSHHAGTVGISLAASCFHMGGRRRHGDEVSEEARWGWGGSGEEVRR